MKTSLALLLLLARSAAADSYDLEVGPVHREATAGGYNGVTFAGSLERASFGVRADIQLAMRSTDDGMDRRIDSVSGGASVLVPFRFARIVRLVLAARLGVDYDQWPSTDGPYIDSALMPTIGAEAALDFDIATFGDTTLWLGPAAGAELRVFGIGNHVKDQTGAFAIRAVVGVRM